MGRQKKKREEDLLPRTYDRIMVEIEMLDSLNRKYGTILTPRDGRRMYIRSEYRKAEKKAVQSLMEQLACINEKRTKQGVPLWTPLSSDRYTIFYAFQFTGELKQDLHNPLKSTCDLLKKAGLIFEDNRVGQEILAKDTRVQYPRAILTIYKFHERYYDKPAPIEEMYQIWLAQMYPTITTNVPERIAV